jgi:hypothetical protein
VREPHLAVSSTREVKRHDFIASVRDMEPSYADLKAAVSHSVGASTAHASTAENILGVCVDSDPTLDELPRGERATVASAYAQLAQAAAIVGIIRSQALLLDEMHELNTMVRGIAQNLPTPGPTPSTSSGVAF